MNRLALFDCDGTLVDSQHNIVACMDEVFAAAGLAPPGDATRRIIGLNLVQAIAALHPQGDEAAHTALADAYRRAFQTRRGAGQVEELLFDGIAETLQALADDDWALGVATGKSDRGLAHVLDHHGLTDHFVTLQTADRHPSKPHPSMIRQAMAEAGASPETTVMIGDTSFDMAMGVAAGARALGVAWGYHGADELTAAGAYRVAAHPSEILEAIK